MATANTAQFTAPPALDQRTSLYLQKLQQIDRLLQGPVETLLRQAHKGGQSGEIEFPALISERDGSPESPSHSTTALCVVTLQKLARLRRRFPWLEKNSKLDDISQSLMDRFRPTNPSELGSNLAKLQSTVFGNLNPLTASYVFRVLLEAGEAEVHCGLGFLALFAMLWPLHRRFPDSLSAGARIEPWEPTAYVTANCLLPLLKVLKVTTRRAELLEAVKKNLAILNSKQTQPDERSRWLFNRELDALCANLLRLSKFTVVPRELTRLASEASSESAALTADGQSTESQEKAFERLRSGLADAINKIGMKSSDGTTEAQRMLDELGNPLLSFLSSPKTFPHATPPWGLRFSKEHERCTDYWTDLHDAAERSLRLCKHLLKTLSSTCDSAKNATSSYESIDKALEDLITANKEVKQHMAKERVLDDAARWCRTIMDREIAHASAGNHTDFDPSELVSAISVAVQWRLISTELQVSDAVSKALLGAREDGSWKLGLPFYSPDNAQGTWPVTSESVWTLTGALQQYPEVDVADTNLFLYLDWLERTKRTFSGEKERYSGWPSDRLRHSRRIHLATTAFSINAVLEIRDLVEFRLWQLCQKRFTCASPAKGLEAIDPVDLGAKHECRTHGLLARMVADTHGTDSPLAVYSLILHGPPGSSKSKVAEALSAEMWKDCGKWGSNKASFIRITPADFTRLGEDRLDSEARLIFELLSHIRGVTIFFDEIDDLLHLRNRKANESPTFMALVVPAMLNRLADLREACPRQEICFLLATNYVEKIEPALIRPGRIDRAVPVVYPDRASRSAMLSRHLENLIVGNEIPKSGVIANKLAHIVSSLAAVRDDFLDLTKGRPWMEIDKTIKKLLKAAFPESKQFDITFKDKVEKLGEADLYVLIGTLREALGKHIPKQSQARNKREVAVHHYESRWTEGRDSPEFLNEAAHHHFSHDANLTEKGFLLEEFMKLENCADLTELIYIVAENEGRPFKRLTEDISQSALGASTGHGKKDVVMEMFKAGQSGDPVDSEASQVQKPNGDGNQAEGLAEPGLQTD